MIWLAALVPQLVVVIVLTLLELRSGRGGGDWLINLQVWAINMIAGLTVYKLVVVWHGASLIDGSALPVWLAVTLFIVTHDLGEYLFHRAQHRIPWLWAMHSLHHSDPDMSALTSNRHFWGDPMIKTLTIWPLAFLVISPTTEALAAYFAVSLWNFVAHANLRLNFGKWSWVLNSPAYHRRHHSQNPDHYDSNFAALFPIFDVLAGSYHRPEGHPATGLERQPRNVVDLLLWPFQYQRRPVASSVADGQAI